MVTQACVNKRIYTLHVYFSYIYTLTCLLYPAHLCIFILRTCIHNLPLYTHLIPAKQLPLRADTVANVNVSGARGINGNRKRLAAYLASMQSSNTSNAGHKNRKQSWP
jgi:hypothetical protein